MQSISHGPWQSRGTTVVLSDDEGDASDLSEDEMNIVLKYPPTRCTKTVPKREQTSGGSTFVLRRHDVTTLNPEMFLNDLVVDFYLNYITQLSNPLAFPYDMAQFYVLNSYFHDKLRANYEKKEEYGEATEDEEEEQEHREDPQGLWNWIFQDDGDRFWSAEVVLMPLFLDDHWSLLIFFGMRDQVSGRKLNEPLPENCSLPFAIHCDSMALLEEPQRIAFHTEYAKKVTGWFSKFLADLRKLSVTEGEEARLRPPVVFPLLTAQTPTQNNLYDCGVFMLQFAESFLRFSPRFNDLQQLQLFSNTDVQQSVPNKRAQIRALIHRLAVDSSTV